MLKKSLPETPAQLLRWDWADFEPLYADLDERRVTFENMDIWLTDWSRVNEAANELAARRYIAVSTNTADEEAARRYQNFTQNFYPKWMEAEHRLQTLLLESGLEPAGFDTILQKVRAEAELFRPENLPLIAEEHQNNTQYERIVGAQTIEWDGEEKTISQLRPLLLEQDRDLRERAWRAGAERQLADRAAVNELWGKQLRLRRQIAANAGLDNFREYRWRELHRFDYTPEDVETFHRAVEEVVVPAARRILERRRQRLGVDTLRPWDEDVDPLGRPVLRPFETIDQLISGASAIFHHVNPDLGEDFDTLAREDLLDLANRKNKGPGAYCNSLDMTGRPFIFANAVGLANDVITVLHESGHAFHVFETRALPYNMQRDVGAEFAEVASMSMELLGARFFDASPDGFFAPADANHVRAQHLERNLLFWPYMSVVDSFQNWVYLNPDSAEDPANCDAKWTELWQRYMPGVDYSGLEDVLATGWHRKVHIHTYPLYYIEYGLAQLGAVQVWSRSLKDPTGAVAAYRRALALGGTVPLGKLYETAGAKLAFDADTLREAVDLMETMIYTYEPQNPAVTAS